jgi:hypothetical protein
LCNRQGSKLKLTSTLAREIHEDVRLFLAAGLDLCGMYIPWLAAPFRDATETSMLNGQLRPVSPPFSVEVHTSPPCTYVCTVHTRPCRPTCRLSLALASLVSTAFSCLSPSQSFDCKSKARGSA